MRTKINKIILHLKDQRKFILKTVFVLAGVLGLQLSLAAAYLYAFHSPQAKEIPIAIIESSNINAEKIKESLKTKAGDSFDVSTVLSRDEAVYELKNHKIYGAYFATFPQGEVIVATASDKKLTDVAQKTLIDFDLAYQTQVRSQLSLDSSTETLSKTIVLSANKTDVAPLSANDPNGTGLFYVAFSFVFGGYLAAVAINIISGGRSFNHRKAVIRSFAFLFFGFIGGLLISNLAVNIIQILPTDKYWAIVGIGTLTTTGVALFASSIISLFGTIGTGIVIVLFVILGTPASGGPLPLLLAGDGPWQTLSAFLPTGQSMEVIRQVVYFDSLNIWNHLWLLISYNLFGFVLLVGFGLRRRSFDLIEEPK